MNVRTRTIISIVLKLLTVVAVLGGLIGCFLDAGGFMGGSGLLLYFTNQSNIWIGTVALVLAVLQIVNLTKGKYGFNKKVYLIQQVFTVSISLTCIVYCFVLVPSFLAAEKYCPRLMLNHHSLLTSRGLQIDRNSLTPPPPLKLP